MKTLQLNHTLHGEYLGLAIRASDCIEELGIDPSAPVDSSTEGIEAFLTSYHSALSSIVFSALSVEAFLNFYISSEISSKHFANYYDKLTIQQKIKFFLIDHKKFPISFGDSYVQDILELFKLRNRLVHFKPMLNIDSHKIGKELLNYFVQGRKSPAFVMEFYARLAEHDTKIILSLISI